MDSRELEHRNKYSKFKGTVFFHESFSPKQCCGTGTVGTATFCRSGTGTIIYVIMDLSGTETVFYYSSGTGT
jgi:hypothetical protein